MWWSRFVGVRYAVFLRSDIYDLLKFGERDKFRGEEMRINWISESLLELLLARGVPGSTRGRQRTVGCDLPIHRGWTADRRVSHPAHPDAPA